MLRYVSEFEATAAVLDLVKEYFPNDKITELRTFSYNNESDNIHVRLFGLAVSDERTVVLEAVEHLTPHFVDMFKALVSRFKDIAFTHTHKLVCGAIICNTADAMAITQAVRKHLRVISISTSKLKKCKEVTSEASESGEGSYSDSPATDSESASK